MMKVRLTSVLNSYTKGQKEVELEGKTVMIIINKLDKMFPGIKFRFVDEHDQIRSHMMIFVDKYRVDDLDMKLYGDEEIFIVQSLSGG